MNNVQLKNKNLLESIAFLPHQLSLCKSTFGYEVEGGNRNVLTKSFLFVGWKQR